MKVVILAGGFGTRISEESHLKPKPMIEIGGKPILWHIMKEYSYHGYNEFIICLGYKSEKVKDFFANYYLYQSDVTINIETGEIEYIRKDSENWKVTLAETGLNTMTGGRIKRIKDYLNNEPFLLTYGDGVSDVDINEVVKYHQSTDNLLTMTVVNMASKFGVLKIDKTGAVKKFKEKSDKDGSIINAGYMVCQPEVLDFIDGDNTSFEKDPIEKISQLGKLGAYKHDGFWKCMDTLRDKEELEQLWNSGEAKWKKW